MDLADHRREATRIQKRRSVVLGSREDVPGCLRSKLTVWKEEQFTVLPFQGIVQKEAGSRVGCQGLALDEARCVGLCAGSGSMVH